MYKKFPQYLTNQQYREIVLFTPILKTLNSSVQFVFRRFICWDAINSGIQFTSAIISESYSIAQIDLIILVHRNELGFVDSEIYDRSWFQFVRKCWINYTVTRNNIFTYNMLSKYKISVNNYVAILRFVKE